MTVLLDGYGNIWATANITVNTAGGYLIGNLIVPATADLGAVGNVTIAGGSNNYALVTDGTGNLNWGNGSSIAAAGTNTQVQYNNNGVFGGSPNFTFTGSNVNITGNTNVNGFVVANNIGASAFYLTSGQTIPAGVGTFTPLLFDISGSYNLASLQLTYDAGTGNFTYTGTGTGVFMISVGVLTSGSGATGDSGVFITVNGIFTRSVDTIKGVGTPVSTGQAVITAALATNGTFSIRMNTSVGGGISVLGPGRTDSGLTITRIA